MSKNVKIFHRQTDRQTEKTSTRSVPELKKQNVVFLFCQVWIGSRATRSNLVKLQTFPSEKLSDSNSGLGGIG